MRLCCGSSCADVQLLKSTLVYRQILPSAIRIPTKRKRFFFAFCPIVHFLKLSVFHAFQYVSDVLFQWISIYFSKHFKFCIFDVFNCFAAIHCAVLHIANRNQPLLQY